MKGAITKTGGRWDPEAWPVYFLASNMNTHGHVVHLHDHLLIAVNELLSPEPLSRFAAWIKNGRNHWLIDSGVYWLSTQHAKRHGLTMNEALSMAPSEVDDFDNLYSAYVKMIREFGDKAWGYIEIDQGGRENKIKTRAKLEKLGLRPIPVYHPLNDGWDYFDYLAERYDRICFGNVVMADSETRKRLVATAWERRRKYPHLWIHLLGMTPNDLLLSWPINSCDSSTWLASARWGQHLAQIANKSCWQMGEGFNYELGVKEACYKAWQFCAYNGAFACRTMRTVRAEQEEVFGLNVGCFQ